jgi:glycosyltransferase involved in cell wall biosynthesis
MKISIITVTYNSAKTIKKTLNSVLSQSMPPYEHIFIDGGSTDETLSILYNYKQSNNNVLIISEPDSGVYFAMNKGIKLATGNIVGFLNSDVFFLNENFIELLSEKFQNSKSKIFYSDILYYDIHSLPYRYWPTRLFKSENFFIGHMPPHPSFYCKKELFSTLGSFNTDFRIAADFELIFRFIYFYKISAEYLDVLSVGMLKRGLSYNSLKTILQQNIEIISVLKYYKEFNFLKFFVGKVKNRILQLFIAFYLRHSFFKSNANMF